MISLKNNKNLFNILLAAATATSMPMISKIVRADESLSEKAGDTKDDAVLQGRKTKRSLKKPARKATDTNTVGDNIKDSAGNAKDEIKNKSSKVKRKLEQ